MIRFVAVAGLSVVALGCGQAAVPQPAPPQPVTVVVPQEGSPPLSPVPATPLPEGVSLEGKWTHALPDAAGKTRPVILEYIRDQDGRERFEFTQHPWPDKPVFVEQKKHGERTELVFRLVANGEEPNAASRTIRYVLHRQDGQWTGQVFESWTETPHSVTLTKSE